MHSPRAKALLASSVFALFGVASYFLHAVPSETLLPESIFYAVLVCNTFFSIRFFTRIAPHDTAQVVMDGILILLYALLALALGASVFFPFVALCLFVAATLKYALLLTQSPHTATLGHKIVIDLLGAFLCIGMFVGVLFGFAFQSLWLGTGLFTLANIYLLFIRPMYRIRS